jgi:hypothetical protein
VKSSPATPWSGKVRALPPSPPLRTGHESFPSSGSSLPNGHQRTRFHEDTLRVAFTIRAWRRLTFWFAFCQSMAFQFTNLPKDAPAIFAVICISFLVVFPNSLVTEDLAEVCPFSWRMMLRFLLAQSLFTPLQDDVCFFRIPLPAIPLICLAGLYLFRGGQRAYHVSLM